MRQFLQLQQGSQAWHEHRLKYRNASETPAVMGVSPWLSPEQFMEIKTGRRVQEVTYPMKRGMKLEPAARAAYEDETGLIVEPCVVLDGEYSASLDGITLQEDLILEIKCPMKGKDSETWQAVAAGNVPAHYYWQVQHQLMVSGAACCHFYVFDGTDGLFLDVGPSPEDMDKLRSAWDLFMARFIDEGEPCFG